MRGVFFCYFKMMCSLNCEINNDIIDELFHLSRYLLQFDISSSVVKYHTLSYEIVSPKLVFYECVMNTRIQKLTLNVKLGLVARNLLMASRNIT